MPERPRDIRLEDDGYQADGQAGCEAVWTTHMELRNTYSLHKHVSWKHDHLHNTTQGAEGLKHWD